MYKHYDIPTVIVVLKILYLFGILTVMELIFSLILLQLNLGQETIRGLFLHWLGLKRQQAASLLNNGDKQSSYEAENGNHLNSKTPANLDSRSSIENGIPTTYPAFEFSVSSLPSIITEGSQGGPWRKKLTELNGNEDEKSLPSWCLDSLLQGKLPPRENAKSVYFPSAPL